jgi:hypothetical protein
MKVHESSFAGLGLQRSDHIERFGQNERAGA